MDAQILFITHVLPEYEMSLLVDFVEKLLFSECKYYFRINTTMTIENTLHVFLFTLTNDK